MMFDEKPSYIMGYLSAATNFEAYRKLWVKMRLKSVGFEVPEYAEFGICRVWNMQSSITQVYKCTNVFFVLCSP